MSELKLCQEVNDSRLFETDSSCVQWLNSDVIWHCQICHYNIKRVQGNIDEWELRERVSCDFKDQPGVADWNNKNLLMDEQEKVLKKKTWWKYRQMI